MHRVGVFRVIAIGATLAASLVVPSPALAGFRVDWSRHGNKARVTWEVDLSDPGHVTVAVRGRQVRGDDPMFVRIDLRSLRCRDGTTDCYSIGPGGVIAIKDGAHWHRLAHHRLPNLPRRSTREKAVTERVDPRSTLIQAKIVVCYGRHSKSARCSRPHYWTVQYGAAGTGAG
jgi:hypothetical protein